MAMLKGNLIDAANRVMAAASINPDTCNSELQVLTIWKQQLPNGGAWIFGKVDPYNNVSV